MEKENQYEMFVGANYNYYERKWQIISETKSSASWNWAAFLFPSYWLAYRKMYLEACAYVILSFLLAIIPLSGIILHVIAGVFANSYYCKHGVKVIEKASDMMGNEAEIYIRKHGGVSNLGVFMVILFSFALVLSIIIVLCVIVPDEEETSVSPKLVDEETYEVTTEEGEITCVVPTSFHEREVNNQDLYYYSEDLNTALIVNIYKEEDFVEEITEESILAIQVEQIKDNGGKIELVEDAVFPQLEDNMVQELYLLKGDNQKNYGYMTCQKIENNYMVTIIWCLPSKWNQLRDMYGDIVLSARLSAES